MNIDFCKILLSAVFCLVLCTGCGEEPSQTILQSSSPVPTIQELGKLQRRNDPGSRTHRG